MQNEAEKWNVLADSRFYCGLDLGTAADHSALVVTERRGSDRTTCHLIISALKRYDLGLDYSTIINDVARRLDAAPKNTRLLVDATGCGRPVFDFLKRHPLLSPRAGRITGIVITGGDAESTADHGIRRVPKRDLVSALQVLLASGRLKIAAGLPETQLLLTEMRNFKVKISISGHDTYEAWRESIHDDLTLAAAMAAWAAVHPSMNAEWGYAPHPRLGGYR